MSFVTISLRLNFPDDIRFGPGKAELLSTIENIGSLSGAARALGMSYPRALKLVDDMNAAFKTPLVGTFQGGAKRGGAVLTKTGRDVLTLYQTIAAKAAAANADHFAQLETLLRESPR